MGLFNRKQPKSSTPFTWRSPRSWMKPIAYVVTGVFLLFRSKDVRRFAKDQAREVRSFVAETKAERGRWVSGLRSARQMTLKKFLRGEAKEIKEFTSGQEDFERFVHNARELAVDFFIPHGGNNFRPKALHKKSLLTYVLLALAVKVVVSGFLFFTYPSPARLLEITSENITRLINESRVENGVEPLAGNVQLMQAAADKGNDMLARQYFAHDTPEGKRPWQWINRGSYDYVYAGENLAMGFITAETAHEALMKSPTHRKNILNPRYKDLGIAVVSGTYEGHPTQILVQFFGTQRGSLTTAVVRNDQPTAPAPEPTVVAQSQPTTTTPAPTSTPVTPTSAPSSTPIVAAAATTTAPTTTPAVAPVTPTTTTKAVAENTERPTTTTAVGQTTSIPAPLTPEAEALLHEGSQNDSVLLVQFERGSRRPIVESIIEYSNIFFLAFLIFLLLVLCLNIFIRFRVQHPDLIFQTVIVIALIAAMALVKFNYVEQLAPQLLIL